MDMIPKYAVWSEKSYRSMTGASDPNEMHEPIKREAWRWVLHMTSGDATADDIAALERWRAQSPLHSEAFAQARERWHAFGLAAQRVALTEGVTVTRRSGTVTRRALLGGAALAAAGSTAFVIVRPPFELWPALREWGAEYRTAAGEQRQVTLTSGASVEMNTRTSLNVGAAAENAEHIELITGETAITAGPQPVEVVAARGRTWAELARFNVRHDGPTVCVTCLDGRVQVEQGGRSVVLQQTQQVTYTDSLGPTASIDPTLIEGWRKGDLYFRDEPLSRVIDEINRYRPGKIVLMNEVLGIRRVTAHFKLDRLGVIITQLRETFGARVTTLPAGIVLVS